MVAKDLGTRIRTVPADFTGGDFGDRGAMRRTLFRDIVCTSRRPGDKPVPDSQRRVRDSSALIF
jgi:hypothetical protein